MLHSALILSLVLIQEGVAWRWVCLGTPALAASQDVLVSPMLSPASAAITKLAAKATMPDAAIPQDDVEKGGQRRIEPHNIMRRSMIFLGLMQQQLVAQSFLPLPHDHVSTDSTHSTPLNSERSTVRRPSWRWKSQSKL